MPKNNTASLVIYTSYLEKCRMMDDAQFGKLMRAILAYQVSGEIPKLDDLAVNMAFEFIKADLDLNNRKYDAIVEKRKAAGVRGAELKKQKLAKQANADFAKKSEAKVSKRKQTQANQAVNDNDNVNDNVFTSNEVNKETGREAMLNAFRDFWDLYPRKEKEDAACRTWISLKPDAALVKEIMDSLRANIAKNGSWKRDGGRYIPKADNWLLERRWRDEVREEKDDPPKAKVVNMFNNFEQREYSKTDYEELEARKLRQGLI